MKVNFYVSPAGVAHRHITRTIVGPLRVVVDSGDWQIQTTIPEMPMKIVVAFLLALRPHNPKRLLIGK